MFTKHNLDDLLLLKQYFDLKEEESYTLRESFALMGDAYPSIYVTEKDWAKKSKKYINCLDELYSEKYKGINQLMEQHNIKNIDDLKYHFKLTFLNTLKSYALGLDGLFKSAGYKDVKFHQVTAAVYQSVYFLMISSNKKNLRQLFGNLCDDQETLNLMQGLLKDFIGGNEGVIAAGNDDQKLNRACNNFAPIDNLFPPRIIKTQEEFLIHGKIKITNAFRAGEAINVADLVNVTLSIDADDAKRIRNDVQKQLEALGFQVGRLTGTNDKDEAHISLALRIPYTKELENLIEQLNFKLTDAVLSTKAELKTVTPPDIRASVSAVGLLSKETTDYLESLQKLIYSVVKKEGNKLPPLHMTHGNSLNKPASLDEIEVLANMTHIDEFLPQYGLDLTEAMRKTKTKDFTFFSDNNRVIPAQKVAETENKKFTV